jgi:hypothetical protein
MTRSTYRSMQEVGSADYLLHTVQILRARCVKACREGETGFQEEGSENLQPKLALLTTLERHALVENDCPRLILIFNFSGRASLWHVVLFLESFPPD